MESRVSKSDSSAVDDLLFPHRRLSAPAKLQTFDIEEPTNIRNRGSDGNVYAII